MTHMLSSAGGTRLRAGVALVLACSIASCQPTEVTTPSTDEAPPAPSTPALAGAVRAGIPFGIWNLPTGDLGSLYSGAYRIIWPEELRTQLAAIKARGGRVVLNFAGNERYFLDRSGNFSLSMWKQRVDRYRSVNFSDYVEDGTIIGHYLIDEPNDPENWNNRPVPGSTVEAMAEYSKRLWPKMATIVRAEPGYLARTGGPYRYLDAAWAQYVTWKGTPLDYIRRNVADAQKLDLALVTGLNILKGVGGTRPMSGSLIRSAGSTILANGYSCAFLSWDYQRDYLSRDDVRQAMAYLASMARSHSTRSCRSGSDVTTNVPLTTAIVLKLSTYFKDGHHYVRLGWTNANGTTVNVFRNGILTDKTPNDGVYVRYYASWSEPRSYTYKVCETGTSRCSNTVTAWIP